jgi:glycosyltransferase involved in cell wall biosynthesis
LGDSDPDHVAEWLCSADAFLSASLWEGESNSLFEAIGAELPLILPSIPAMRDIVPESFAYYYTRGDRDGLREAMDRCRSVCETYRRGVSVVLRDDLKASRDSSALTALWMTALEID